MKSKNEIELFLTMNEPAFEIGDVQYSVCCSTDGQFFTWDSTGKKLNFHGIDNLLDSWIVGGRKFGEVVDTIMQ